MDSLHSQHSLHSLPDDILIYILCMLTYTELIRCRFIYNRKINSIISYVLKHKYERAANIIKRNKRFWRTIKNCRLMEKNNSNDINNIILENDKLNLDRRFYEVDENNKLKLNYLPYHLPRMWLKQNTDCLGYMNIYNTGNFITRFRFLKEYDGNIFLTINNHCEIKYSGPFKAGQIIRSPIYFTMNFNFYGSNDKNLYFELEIEYAFLKNDNDNSSNIINRNIHEYKSILFKYKNMKIVNLK